MSSGKTFFQEFFEDGPISNIILQHPRSRTNTTLKQQGKTHVEKQVEKHVKKKPMSKAKDSQKMLQWMKMDSNELNMFKHAYLENKFNMQWTTPREDL